MELDSSKQYVVVLDGWLYGPMDLEQAAALVETLPGEAYLAPALPHPDAMFSLVDECWDVNVDLSLETARAWVKARLIELISVDATQEVVDVVYELAHRGDLDNERASHLMRLARDGADPLQALL